MLNKKVRLSVWATILGTFNEITINGELNYDMVMSMGFDVVATYENIRSEIPEEHLVKMKDDKYIVFTDHTGKRGFLGMSWIKPNSIVEISDAVTVLRIKGSDVDALKTLLNYSNYTVLSAEIEGE